MSTLGEELAAFQNLHLHYQHLGTCTNNHHERPLAINYEIRYQYSEVVQFKRWPLCGPTQQFSRHVWSRAAGERSPVLVAVVGDSPVLNLAAADQSLFTVDLVDNRATLMNREGNPAAIVVTGTHGKGACQCCGADKSPSIDCLAAANDLLAKLGNK
jgi:hypothetical protein